ncbi:MAG: hypothetical protein RSA74_10625, partial [Chryseobacterium sp.]
MKKYTSLISLFLIHLYFSQQIKIHVKDSDKALSDINVQLQKSGKTLDFKKTDDFGNCTFAVAEHGIFTVKLSSMLYKAKTVEINSTENSDFTIQIEKQITEIEEVEIKSRPDIVKIKGDTIAFNIKSVKDGTERTAEDIIKKLSGLDINENGKVSFKGNLIGQVLVEGNEFFGKNHKMATQNLSADMIEGVDVWQNYTTISGGRSTALNLKLKEEFKGKIKGNIEGNYGTGNSYFGHSNLFKINKFGNLALIADANNVAKDPISFMDFYEMNSQEEEGSSENSSKVDVPSFLNNDGRVKSKANQFGALQYSKATKKISISAFSIFNSAQLQKLSSTQRMFFDPQYQNLNFNEEKSESNKGLLGTAQVKMRKTFADKSFLYYNFAYNSTDDHFAQNINRFASDPFYYDIADKVSKSNFTNSLLWNKPFENSELIIAFNHQRNNFSGNLNILSNGKLFFTDSEILLQDYNITSDKYTFNFYYKNRNKILNYDFQSGFSYKNDESELKELISQEREDLFLKMYHYTNSFSLHKQIGKFTLSGALSSHFLSVNTAEKHFFEKNIKIRFTPKTVVSMEYGLEYSNRYNFPSLYLLQENPVYAKELSFSRNANLNFDTLNNTESFKINWNRFNIEKGNLMFVILTYEKSKNYFTANVTNYGLFSELGNVVGNFRERSLFLLSNDRRILKNLTLKSKFTWLNNKSDNFINSQPNISTIQNIEVSQRLSSNFKKSWVQFDAGYTFTKSKFQQSLYGTSSDQENIKLSLGFRAIIRKEWQVNVLGDYFIQKTDFAKLENVLIGGQISYRKEKSAIEYNLYFNNILNLT